MHGRYSWIGLDRSLVFLKAKSEKSFRCSFGLHKGIEVQKVHLQHSVILLGSRRPSSYMWGLNPEGVGVKVL